MMKFTLVVQHVDAVPETYTVGSGKQAYRIYDNAIRQGYAVLQFTNERGTDMRDRPQSLMGWTERSAQETTTPAGSANTNGR